MAEFPPMADRMTCIDIPSPGKAESLRPTHRPVPLPGDEDVLLAVAAAGVNRPDILQRQGAYPPPPGASDIPGLEVAGTILAVGASVTRWRSGDQVCALLTGGGYASHALAHQDLCLRVPKGFSLLQAAALPETMFTVWHNVFERAALRDGETLLVHGGSSGIGTTAIQLAKAFGATVFITAGSAEKCAACARLGADKTINYRQEDFVEAIKGAGLGVDVILDMVGGAYVSKAPKILRPDGRHVSIAFLQGSTVEMDFMTIMLKRLTFTGSTLRSRSIPFKAALAQALEKNVWPKLDSGIITPVIAQTVPLRHAAKAHRILENRTHIGKIMLTVD